MANVSDIGDILPGVVKNFGTNWSSVVLSIPPKSGDQVTGYIYKSGTSIKLAILCVPGNTTKYATITTVPIGYRCDSLPMASVVTSYIDGTGSLNVRSGDFNGSLNDNIQYVVYR
jgi:hypothetical protein